MDIYSPEKRSQVMASVKSKDTRPELIVRKLLFSMGYRYRINYSQLPGKPDIVLPKHRLAIFVHGCFWHHHRGCSKSKYPVTNHLFWVQKIRTNVKRDRRNIAKLKGLGWKVMVIWECETETANLRSLLATNLCSQLEI